MGADDERPQTAKDGGRATAGTQLSGIYELDERIGFGGMGEVWRGHNIHTGDHVAIKIVLPELAREQTILSLFRKEASILNHLSHDAVVRYHVFTVAPNIGRPYLAMEFVSGESLFDVMLRGPMPVDDVRRLCHRLAQGLNAVHEAGAVHRDLSPDNVILPQGKVERAKIIDFGIARSAQAGETLIGDKFAGKYNYVSPEQVGLYGGDVGKQSDIYSLGLVLAGALRGSPLDMGGSHLEIVEKRRAVPDLTDVDEIFRPILTAMLQPQPRDRPASMAVIAALTRTEIGESGKTVPPPYQQPASAPPWEAPHVGGRPASSPPGARTQDHPIFVPHVPPAQLPRAGADSPVSHGAAEPSPRRSFAAAKVAIALAATLAVGVGGGLYLSGRTPPSEPAIAEKLQPAQATAPDTAVSTEPSGAIPQTGTEEPSIAVTASQETGNPQSQGVPDPAPSQPASAPSQPAPNQPPLDTSANAPPAPAPAAADNDQSTDDQATINTANAPSASTPPAPVASAANDEQPAELADNSTPTANPEDADLLGKLIAVGVDYSVAEAEIRDWLVNVYTPYPAYAAALLELLKERGLRKPVYIDVIAGSYESAPGASPPTSVEEVDIDRLKAAILDGYNSRYGENVKSFERILR